ncbi:MAG TPA: DUF3634 family protein [Luteolibacter sp.]
MSLLSFLYSEWLDVRNGKAVQRKGRLTHRTLREINDVLAEQSIAKGHIRSSGNGRYQFSRSIPKPLHQRLRNLLASD